MSDQPSKPKPTKRNFPRLKNKHATSLFGDVFDLSGGGMKIFRKSSKLVQIGDEFEVDLHCENLSVLLQVRVAHRECVGFHRHVYGVEFIDLNAGLNVKIGRLIQAACDPCASPSCWIAA